MAVRIWILLSAILVGAGWVLSGLHQLNRTGYAVALALGGVGIWFYLRAAVSKNSSRRLRSCSRFYSRFSRPAPFLFLVLAALAFLGGALYASLNPDTNSYRLPRVLHWLWAGRWEFIHGGDQRLNFVAVGWEWLAAPLVLFTKTDRSLFLINFAAFLLLPGLIFSVFRRLQVSGRVAWWWMWLLPSGWCYILQASSCVNDAYAAVYALAAVDLALRAREKNSLMDLWLSAVAIALATGVKQTNIPLVLLWVIPAFTCWRLGGRQAGGTILAVGVALLVSALPITVSNLHYYGDWLGASANHWKGALTSPFWGLVGNLFCFPAQNLLPPFFPWSDAWNAMMDRFVTTPLGSHFSSFEHFGVLSRNLHGVNENNAGIGLGICVFLPMSLVAAWWLRRRRLTGAAPQSDWTVRLLWYAPWALLVLYLAKVGTYENARQFAPYYPFLFPSLLAGSSQALLARRIWWQRLGLVMMASAVLLLVISRERPLFPAQTILNGLEKRYPASHIVKRVAFAFDVRSAGGADFRNWVDRNVPTGERVIGLGSVSSTLEPQLWLPFGKRAVERLLPEDTTQQLVGGGIRYVLVDGEFLEMQKMTIDAWRERMQGDLAGEYHFQLMAGQPEEVIYLVRLAGKN